MAILFSPSVRTQEKVNNDYDHVQKAFHSFKGGMIFNHYVINFLVPTGRGLNGRQQL